MGKKKLIHFKENKTFPNLFQYNFYELKNKEFPLKGKWHKEYFRNNNPIILELGCGKGEYTTNLAISNPHRNYIGIDIKGARIWVGCKTAIENNMDNVAFIRTKVELSDYFFDKNEVSEIWLTFPDPQPKKRREKRCLTSSKFLDIYKQILVPGGNIYLKTDNTQLYHYTLDIIKEYKHKLIYKTDNIDKSDVDNKPLSIETFYESMFREEGSTIKFIEFSLK